MFKDKFKGTKSWGVGDTPALMQAHFMALLQNLLPVLLGRLEHIDTPDQQVVDKTAKRRAAVPEHQRVPAQEMVRHAHALTCQFIRLIKHCLRFKFPREEALPLFKQLLKSYL